MTDDDHGRDAPSGDDGHGHQAPTGDDEHGHQAPTGDDEHGHHAHDPAAVGAGVVTVSSSRSLDEDPSGDVVEEAFEEEGHEVVFRELVRDDFDRVQTIVDRMADREDVDVVVTTGGTGVTPDDVTVEAVEPLLDRALPGFGELFRTLSYEEIGTRVVATRATAGIADGVPVFCLPGSENAARLGTEEIVVPEAPHLAGLAGRTDDEKPDGPAKREGETNGTERS